MLIIGVYVSVHMSLICTHWGVIWVCMHWHTWVWRVCKQTCMGLSVHPGRCCMNVDTPAFVSLCVYGDHKWCSITRYFVLSIDGLVSEHVLHSTLSRVVHLLWSLFIPVSPGMKSTLSWLIWNLLSPVGPGTKSTLSWWWTSSELAVCIQSVFFLPPLLPL